LAKKNLGGNILVVPGWEGGEWDGVVCPAMGGGKIIDGLARGRKTMVMTWERSRFWMVKHYVGDDSGVPR
jgi:hypothetical protein